MRVVDKDIMLRPGMSMTADIETETKQNVLTVPDPVRDHPHAEGGDEGNRRAGTARAAR